ncbi:MAG TPA: helix-turn-helix domain-containing protein [Rhizomicrobium sp.]|nr:helix-turn-helix domain-containing protein [Rhizomicrobium sp.]
MSAMVKMLNDMKIGALSRRTGCAIETIRFYEKAGIVPHARREGRYRHYDAADAARLIFIRRARELGFTLGEVRTLLELSAKSEDACDEVRALAADHLAKVRTKLADLRSMERALAQAVQNCDAGEQATCPLIDSMSAPAIPGVLA